MDDVLYADNTADSDFLEESELESEDFLDDGEDLDEDLGSLEDLDLY